MSSDQPERPDAAGDARPARDRDTHPPGTPPSAGPEPAPRDGSGGADLPPPGMVGPQLARAALDAARARRKATPARRAGGTGGAAPTRRRGYTGTGPDARDPQPLAAVLGRLVRDRGWQRPTAEATVFARWDRVVGPDVAAHCRPVKLDGGELVVEAESTAWATQLRLLTARLLARIGQEVGHNVVTRLNIRGPSTGRGYQGPRWVRDRRGPRDQYE